MTILSTIILLAEARVVTISIITRGIVPTRTGRTLIYIYLTVCSFEACVGAVTRVLVDQVDAGCVVLAGCVGTFVDVDLAVLASKARSASTLVTL